MKKEKFITSKDPLPNFLLNRLPPLSLFQYWKMRLGMKLLKCKLIKGWEYDIPNGKIIYY